MVLNLTGMRGPVRSRGAVKSKAPRKATTAGTVSKRQGKYNARGERVDGRWFDSAAEAERYRQLKRMEQAGLVERIECQVRFPLVVNGTPIAAYLADFRYAVLDPHGRAVKVVVEDVKGMVTDVYALKRKLMAALYPVMLVEIPAKKVGEWEGRVP